MSGQLSTLTRAEAAKRFGVSVTAVRKWERQGRLQATLNRDGLACFTLQDVILVERYRKDNGFNGLKKSFPRKGAVPQTVATGEKTQEYLNTIDKLIDLYEERKVVLRRLITLHSGTK